MKMGPYEVSADVVEVSPTSLSVKCSGDQVAIKKDGVVVHQEEMPTLIIIDMSMSNGRYQDDGPGQDGEVEVLSLSGTPTGGGEVGNPTNDR